MKEVIKNKTKKILTILLIILSPIFIYLLVDWKNLYVDIYNFWQLNKAKPYLETIDKNTKKFYNLKEFNEIYSAWIKPIKNCYSVNMNNWKYIYKFWFKLESYIYIYIYWNEYYMYPWDDMPVQSVCVWWHWFCEDEIEKDSVIPYVKNCEFNWECFDTNRRAFENIISEPCRD